MKHLIDQVNGVSSSVDSTLANIKPGYKEKYVSSGNSYMYVLEPGDKTKYTIVLTHITEETMLDNLNMILTDTVYLVTFITLKGMTSFPVDITSIWDKSYLKQKFNLTDVYTPIVLKTMLQYIAEDIIDGSIMQAED